MISSSCYDLSVNLAIILQRQNYGHQRWINILSLLHFIFSYCTMNVVAEKHSPCLLNQSGEQTTDMKA